MDRTKGGWSEGDFPHKDVTSQIIAAAIAVHKALGPGFLEVLYENAMVIELTKRGLNVRRQVIIPVYYDGQLIGDHRADLIVESAVVVELKAAAQLHSIHQAQTLSTLKAAKLKVALLINFNVTRLVDGVERIANLY